MGNISGKEEVI